MIRAEFEIFFRIHFRSAVLIAQRIVISKDAAEDIVQDVFVRMLDSDFSKIKSPASFLYTSVRNASIDYIRVNTVRIFEQLSDDKVNDLGSNCDLGEDDAEYLTNLHNLSQAIERLPEQARAVVKLVCLDKYSYQQAADKMGVSVNTVKTHMYRSFKNMKKNLLVFFV